MSSRARNRVLALGLTAALVLVLGLSARSQSAETAKDPVCGMTVKTAGAKFSHEYKGTTYYFCNAGCREAFKADPEKYLPAQAAAQPACCGTDETCPFMLPDVERKVEAKASGVVITLTSKNPETVKKLQDHAAAMAEGRCPMTKPGVEKAPAAPAAAPDGGSCSGSCCAGTIKK